MSTIQDLATLRPFGIGNRFRDPLRRGAMALARPAIERMLALPALNDIHEAIMTMPGDEHRVDKALRVLSVNYHLSDEDLARIPKEGPLIVAANHPFGGLDGLILLSLIRRARPDVKLMANFLLQSVVFMRDSMVLVDPFKSDGASKRNIGGLKHAIRFIRDGGALGVFPAGEVAHISLSNPHVHEPEWNQTIAGLVRSTRAPLLPVFFDGNNSLTFQLLGLLHPRLRTAMLPRELLKRKHSRIKVRVGNLIPYEKLAKFADSEEITAYVRVRTYILKGRPDASMAEVESVPATHVRRRQMQPIMEPPPTDLMVRDLERLSDDRRLLSNGSIEVVVAGANEIPHILQEIGRAREISFREVGEGTGRPTDIDAFDHYYLHLFAWDHKERALVGAYRVGQTDVILPRYGVHGLYTRTLFRFRSSLIRQLNPALELGRSFVSPQYQNSYSALMLLWKGIGRFVAAHPRYRMLFGPVSISNQYQSMSKQLLMTFLRINRYLPQLARRIRPRKPVRLPPLRWWDPKITGQVVPDIMDVDELISEIEADRLGVPVLLRQYLKLDAKLLGFNVDPQFGDVVDGLMLADVTKMDRRVLQRYLGPESDNYLAYHRARG